MSKLTEMKCVACHRDAPTVTDEEMSELKPKIPDWKLLEVDGDNRLENSYTFNNFSDAMAFSIQVGVISEEEGHHPAILTEWGKVKVSWWTHKIKGLHKNDFIMAAKTDQLYPEN